MTWEGLISAISMYNGKPKIRIGIYSFEVDDCDNDYIFGYTIGGVSIAFVDSEMTKIQNERMAEIVIDYSNFEFDGVEILEDEESETMDSLIETFVSKLRNLSKDNVVSFELRINSEGYTKSEQIFNPIPGKSMRNLKNEFVK